ncbi:RNA polymerase factor sigma-54 [Metabacillus sp. KIGAM252]|uniref:RNA polymerase factor sigma-54 n=1 Tax=Metabacillus flavus TaxID=2823519 RepID=A0ABS5LII4_9BACI|nr:RNA polymerase factor sigma-54 [Metabacillus flavus]MBS2970556.1 RNA polymerase factor sigma-54 [Metabacillus flavus]
MNMKTGLSQEQSLKLHLSQELKQAITLLQYNAMELEQYVQELALDNPLIEINEQVNPNVFYHRRRSQGASGDYSQIDLIGSQSRSLAEYLFDQLRMIGETNRIVKGTRMFAEQVDENGYLDENAGIRCHGFSAAEEEECLRILQSLDPAGVGARNLQECLILQISRHQRKPKSAMDIISRYFKLFADHSWKELARISGYKIQEIQDTYDYIQTLHPKPGSTYEGTHASYIIPDLVIERAGEGFEAGCNEAALPEISISSEYEALKNQSGQEELKKYLSAKQQQGMWLLKTLDQRKETMVKVMKEILSVQQAFFQTGKTELLKPLTLNDLAEACGIHESTVSRALKGKYVQTPYGTLEMKFFLTNKIGSITESDQSAAAAKEMLMRLINNEDKTSPLSDQMIAAVMLERHDLKLSRRTIAKYRDQLKIPASSIRRRYTEASND